MPIIQFVVWAVAAVVASVVLQPAAAAAATDDDVDPTPKRRRTEPSSWSYLDDTPARCVSPPTSFPTTSLHQPLSLLLLPPAAGSHPLAHLT